MIFFHNRKGITPIISVVLLLMMTIAIAGLAFTWLQRMEGTIEASAEEGAQELLTGLRVQLRVEGYTAKCYTGVDVTEILFTIRNAGTRTANNPRLYVDDSLINLTNYTTLDAGTVTSFQLEGNLSCSDWINQTKVIKVTSDESTSEKVFTIRCSTGSC